VAISPDGVEALIYWCSQTATAAQAHLDNRVVNYLERKLTALIIHRTPNQIEQIVAAIEEAKKKRSGGHDL
jgi:hypothetical protein